MYLWFYESLMIPVNLILYKNQVYILNIQNVEEIYNAQIFHPLIIVQSCH
jgi:hypothetical protein